MPCLSDQKLARLAALLSLYELEMVAIEYFRLSGAEVQNSRADYMHNSAGFRRDLLLIYRNKVHSRKNLYMVGKWDTKLITSYIIPMGWGEEVCCCDCGCCCCCIWRVSGIQRSLPVASSQWDVWKFWHLNVKAIFDVAFYFTYIKTCSFIHTFVSKLLVPIPQVDRYPNYQPLLPPMKVPSNLNILDRPSMWLRRLLTPTSQLERHAETAKQVC